MEAVKIISVVLLLLAPFVLIIYFAVRYQKRMFVRAWDNVELLLNEFSVVIRSPIPDDRTQILKISGEKNHCNIHVFSYYVGSGKNKQLVTKTEVMGILSSAEFTVYRENIFTHIGEVLGMQDVKTGDEVFDKTYRLKSPHPEEVLRLFTDRIRNEFVLAKKEFSGTIALKNHRLTIVTNTSPGNKPGLKLFRTTFFLALLFIEKKRSSVIAHSPKEV